MQAIYDVHKFGGSSLANAERIKALPSLLNGKNEIIVVSAMQGVTTVLQTILDKAREKSSWQTLLEDLKKQHEVVINTLITDRKQDLINIINADISHINDILQAIHLTGHYSTEMQNIILGYGELWSAQILYHYLSASDNILYLDASKFLFISIENGIVCVDWQRSAQALSALLNNNIYNRIIITGFIAATKEGARTILGRNGSDFSAAIFAKLFNAKSVTIWTDVDGIYTADPHKVRSAFVIESLSYLEALELAYFGAKVLHPMTIAPVLELKIPMYIKNSFHPQAKGTCISDAAGNGNYIIKGLTAIDHIALVNIEGAGMIGVSGMASRIFNILYQENISAILIAQASSEHSICFAIAESDTEKALQALNRQLKFEMENQQIQRILIQKSCGILSAVGDGMIGAIGISGQLCNALARANINIRAISQGSSERNISVVIDSAQINKALQAVHAGFYLSPKTISIGMIGPGQVGGCLLDQIRDSLPMTADANLLVRGVMSSKKMLLAPQTLDLSSWREQFAACDSPANLDEFVAHILADDIPHAVIIDCTANTEIAKHYDDFIAKGIHVITPNKHANAGELAYYKKLKALTKKRGKHYFYEATVCAGLPVINTLQDILKTGDKINKIEGIVSGTLSYIFNELANQRKFSDIIRDAMQSGYTEPDPREDLSGKDVARKLVCLAREIGHDVNLADVKVNDLVPQDLQQCSVEEFLQKLPAYDEQFASLAEKARINNEKLAYVGSIDANGKIEVAINSYANQHPFSRLQETDNMLIFHTSRYHKQPLVIQGPGAGAEVTAAGVFADLLRLSALLS